MSTPRIREVTITHNLDSDDAKSEVCHLLKNRLIAIDHGRNWCTTNPDDHKGRARTDLKLFLAIKREGAAVIAAYKLATDRKSDRLIGWVAPRSGFRKYHGLLCLKLVKSRIVDASTSFLGNLPPRGTIQPCHDRARGRLASLVLGKPINRSVGSLHHLDVELLVTNYLIRSGLCRVVWSGGRSFEDIDHVGIGGDQQEILAQTTVSRIVIADKAIKLHKHRTPNCRLMLFGPEEARGDCTPPIEFCAIETVFAEMDACPEGRWLIDRMLKARRGPHAKRRSSRLPALIDASSPLTFEAAPT